jgi:hypothetical protein
VLRLCLQPQRAELEVSLKSRPRPPHRRAHTRSAATHGSQHRRRRRPRLPATRGISLTTYRPTTTPPWPPIEALARARFYPDEAAVRENAARRSAALEGLFLSVDDLRKMKRDDLPKFNDATRRAGVSSYPEVERFFARDGFPIEALIGERGILVLNGAPEWELFEERYVEDVPGVNATFAEPEAKKSDGDGRGGRSEPLCFVVGGSGAGKTFFAMREELRTFRKPGGLRRSATAYVKPVNLDRDVPNVSGTPPRRPGGSSLRFGGGSRRTYRTAFDRAGGGRNLTFTCAWCWTRPGRET